MLSNAKEKRNKSYLENKINNYSSINYGIHYTKNKRGEYCKAVSLNLKFLSIEWSQ